MPVCTYLSANIGRMNHLLLGLPRCLLTTRQGVRGYGFWAVARLSVSFPFSSPLTDSFTSVYTAGAYPMIRFIWTSPAMVHPSAASVCGMRRSSKRSPAALWLRPVQGRRSGLLLRWFKVEGVFVRPCSLLLRSLSGCRCLDGEARRAPLRADIGVHPADPAIVGHVAQSRRLAAS